MLKEFKEFAIKGNLIDTAVAFVMATAFGKIISAFVDGMVMPVVGKLTSGKDFGKMVFELTKGTKEVIGTDGKVVTEAVEAVSIKYGTFITVVIDFLIVAIVMFMVVKAVNKLKKAEPAPPPPPPSTSEVLLAEIRDALKK
jgi:large conductance mechanosensitive channel